MDVSAVNCPCLQLSIDSRNSVLASGDIILLMKTELILIRHGETETNIRGELHSDKDIKTLTKTGIAQVEKTAKKLQEHNPFVIYSSNEKRAVESAEIIAKACKLPLQQIDGLQERNWGEFSGKTWPEVAKVLDKMSLEERYNYVPPKGESWKTFYERIKNAIDTVIQKNEGETIVIVTHGGAIRIIMPYLLDRPKEESFKHDPANASITIFEHIDGEFKRILADDTSHLKSDR